MTAYQTESRVLALLRNRYEADGFSFIEHPDSAALPAFMRGYRPDALALGKDKSIAIEVKMRRTSVMEESLKAITERFRDQPLWELHVVYGDQIEDQPIAPPTPEQIQIQLKEAEALLAENHPRAALVLGWAAVEAIARALSPDFPASGGRTMRQAVELLEHLGRLRFHEAQELRRLIPLRAKVVHGDLQTPITPAEVEPVLKAARAALAAAA
jgi:REase_AHJR-like protein